MLLTTKQQDEYRERGFTTLSAAFAEDAGGLSDLVWQALENQGVRRDEPDTWESVDLRPLKRLAKSNAFAAVANDRLAAGLDDLLGAGRWSASPWGQPLVTFPAAEGTNWTIPAKVWHLDFPATADAARAVRMFAYLNHVRPRGGGTLVVAGSHRVVAAWRERNPSGAGRSADAKKALAQQHEWFGALLRRDAQRDDQRFLGGHTDVAGVPVRVVELARDAGDVVLWHPWLLHTIAPNCGDQPRFMLTHTAFGNDWAGYGLAQPG